MFSELFAPVSIGVRTIAKTVRILERNHFQSGLVFWRWRLTEDRSIDAAVRNLMLSDIVLAVISIIGNDLSLGDI